MMWLFATVRMPSVGGREQPDHAAWLARAADGDGAALAALYDWHARGVYSIALRVVGNEADAEDVVQEVFTQAWRQAGRYDATRAPVVGWLLVMARARALDRLRARRSRLAPVALETAVADPVDPGPGQELQAISHEEAERLRRALEELPEGQREAIELAYYKGLSQSDIAEELRQPLGTVKTRMRTGLLKLRDVLRGRQS
jgi:RNA polymerase sigma-70 factor, ECF subfamily